MKLMRGARTILAILSFGVCLSGAASAQNQSPTNRAPYDGADTLNGPKPIHIDGNCRILPGSEFAGVKKKTHPYNDSAICSIKGPVESQHQEEKVAGNELQRWLVRVKERTFVLQDISDDPVLYVVQFDVPQNWVIDSDPQPWQMAGQTAYFRVYVKPGQTERLHVGVRRMWPQKSKPI
jgi:hypothetical protein